MPGMLTMKELQAAVSAGEIDTVVACFPDMQGRLVGKRMQAEYFLDSAHVKDLLATLRFAQNPRDRVAGFRLLQMLPGIGPQTAGKILDAIAADPEPLAALAPRSDGGTGLA